MKYLSYTLTIIWTVIRKVIGLPITLIVLPFRGYARNVVYNYVLDNNIYLVRLLERPIVETPHEYVIGAYHGTKGGAVTRRDVSAVEYYIVYYVLWQWMDDDSNEDTFDVGYAKTIISGERMSWVGSGIRDAMQDSVNNSSYGNSFDIGDNRTTTWKYEFWATLFWTARNISMNSGYMQRHSSTQYFFHQFGKYKFGWELDGELHGEPSYEIRCGTWH